MLLNWASGKHWRGSKRTSRSEEHTSEQSPCNLVCRLLLEKKKTGAAAHGASGWPAVDCPGGENADPACDPVGPPTACCFLPSHGRTGFPPDAYPASFG